MAAKEDEDNKFTFKPNLGKSARSKIRNDINDNPSFNQKGMESYFKKVSRANAMKEDKKFDEENAFITGSKWTPNVTEATAPNLTVKKTKQKHKNLHLGPISLESTLRAPIPKD